MRILLSGVLLFFFASGAFTADAQRPNVLILMAEDMSARVGAFGDNVAVTPNLDALARQGVRFPNVFTTAGVCAPSRAGHILGMHQISTGTQHMRTSGRPEGGYFSVPPVEVKAYPELLRAAGYYTYTDFKLDYQFSHAAANSGPFTIWDAQGSKASGWRDKADGQPFFALINFMETHESGVFTPLGTMPNSFTHLIMQGMRWWRLDADAPTVVSSDQVVVPPYYPDTQTVRDDISRHYNNIALMDARVGEILQQLENDGLAEDTIVIWTTDHGDGLPRAKRELHDAGTRVPMIIRWPDHFRPAHLQPGQLDKRLLSFVDIAPTILKLSAIKPPEYLHGENFLDPAATPRTYVFSSRDRIDEVNDRQRSVRDQRFRYIRSWYPELEMGHPLEFRENIAMVREMRQMHLGGKLNPQQARWFQPAGKERLYDIKADPHELIDLASNPAYANELQRLRQALEAHLARVGDWSEQSENDMVDSFEPGGERFVTSSPTVSIKDNVLTAMPVSAGSSVGYSLDNGERWLLYSGPVSVPAESQVLVKAVRYGWRESDEVIARSTQ
ncbi:MAG: sulfatase-like hydrolase/transferase [Halioglobus sp.]